LKYFDKVEDLNNKVTVFYSRFIDEIVVIEEDIRQREKSIEIALYMLVHFVQQVSPLLQKIK